MTTPSRIGFIGLGVMGGPMALNLLAAGHPVVGFNRTANKTEALAEHGIIVAGGPTEVAEESEVLITMLPNSPDVEAVLLGERGALEAASPGQLIIDMSTISPISARKLAREAAARDLAMLDAPVSGGDVGARDGTLSIMVGGEEDHVERARPLFEVMGSSVTHVGPAGAGQITKACNQIIVALTIAAVSEGLVLGRQAGVDPERIVEAIRGGLAGSQLLEAKGQKLLSHEFAPGFRVSLHHKDLGIALAAAREYGASLPLTAEVDQMFTALEQRGRGDQDHTALLALTEELAGLE